MNEVPILTLIAKILAWSTYTYFLLSEVWNANQESMSGAFRKPKNQNSQLYGDKT